MVRLLELARSVGDALADAADPDHVLLVVGARARDEPGGAVYDLVDRLRWGSSCRQLKKIGMSDHALAHRLDPDVDRAIVPIIQLGVPGVIGGKCMVRL